MACPTCGTASLRRHCATPLLGKLADMGEVGSSRACTWVVCTRCHGYGDRAEAGDWSAGRAR